jgi:hypothetical protein
VPDVNLATDVFVVLALIADALVALAVLTAVVAVVVPSTRRASATVVRRLGPVALPAAWAVATVCTAGSLYYSEHAGYTPCELCWYQRILMYPLVVVLGVGALRRARGVALTAAPFLMIGPAVSLYHWLVERVPSLADGSGCSVLVPCSVPYFERLGFVTLAWMCLSGFLLTGVLVAVGALHERSVAAYPAVTAAATTGPVAARGAARPEESTGP